MKKDTTKDSRPSVKLEDMTLTKKQLGMPTSMSGRTGARMLTIAELSIDQLRVLVWLQMREAVQVDKLVKRAFDALSDAMP